MRAPGLEWGRERAARLRALVEYDRAMWPEANLAPSHECLGRALELTARAWVCTLVIADLRVAATGGPNERELLSQLCVDIDLAFDTIEEMSRHAPGTVMQPRLDHLRAADVADARLSLRCCRMVATAARAAAGNPTETQLAARAARARLRAERAWANPVLRLRLDAPRKAH